MTDKL